MCPANRRSPRPCPSARGPPEPVAGDMTPTRFIRSPAIYARLLLAALALLMAIGIVQTIAPAPGPHFGSADRGDAALYRAITARTALEGYYAAAISEQRARDYPVRPFVTVREPALASLSAH